MDTRDDFLSVQSQREAPAAVPRPSMEKLIEATERSANHSDSFSGGCACCDMAQNCHESVTRRNCCMLLHRPCMCGDYTMSAPTWWVISYYVVILCTAITGDVSLGVPGEMRWYLIYHVPTLTLIATVDAVLYLLLHEVFTVLYVGWCFAYATQIGMNDLWTPDGGNMVAVLVTLAIIPLFLLLPAAIVAIALKQDQDVIQHDVASWVLQAREMERFMRLLTLAATSYIYPYALKLLQAGVTASEVDCIVLVFAIEVTPVVYRPHQPLHSVASVPAIMEGHGTAYEGPAPGGRRGCYLSTGAGRYSSEEGGAAAAAPGDATVVPVLAAGRARLHHGVQLEVNEPDGSRRRGSTAGTGPGTGTDGGVGASHMDMSEGGSSYDAAIKVPGRLAGSVSNGLVVTNGGVPRLGSFLGPGTTSSSRYTQPDQLPADGTEYGGETSAGRVDVETKNVAPEDESEDFHRAAVKYEALLRIRAQLNAYSDRITCLTVVDNEVVCAVHAAHMPVSSGVQTNSQESRRAVSRQTSGLPDSTVAGSISAGAGTATRQRGATAASSPAQGQASLLAGDPAPARRVADALEAALSIVARTTRTQDMGAHGYKVRVGAGISSGPPTVVGFFGSETSAHQWTAFGDATYEASSLAKQSPHSVRMSSRAATLITSCTSWGFVPRRKFRRQEPEGSTADQERQVYYHRAQQALRQRAKAMMEGFKKHPMPTEAIAYGQTVLSKYQLQVWTPAGNRSPANARAQYTHFHLVSQNTGTGRGSESGSWKGTTNREVDGPLEQATSIVKAEEVLSSLRDMKRVLVDNYEYIHRRQCADPSVVTEVTTLGRGGSRAPRFANGGVLEVPPEEPVSAAAAKISRRLLEEGRNIPSGLLHGLQVPNLRWGLERALVMTVGYSAGIYTRHTNGRPSPAPSSGNGSVFDPETMEEVAGAQSGALSSGGSRHGSRGKHRWADRLSRPGANRVAPRPGASGGLARVAPAERLTYSSSTGPSSGRSEDSGPFQMMLANRRRQENPIMGSVAESMHESIALRPQTIAAETPSVFNAARLAVQPTAAYIIVYQPGLVLLVSALVFISYVGRVARMEAVHSSSIIREDEATREVAAWYLGVPAFVVSIAVFVSVLSLSALLSGFTGSCGCFQLLDVAMPLSSATTWAYLFAYFALFAAHTVSMTLLLANETDGCVHYRELDGLIEGCMLSNMLVFAFFQATELHGWMRLAQPTRVAQLGIMFAVGGLYCWWYGSETGAVSLLSDTNSRSCASRLDPRQEVIGSSELVWIGIRVFVMSVMIFGVRDERLNLVWTLRERILHYLEVASVTLVDRAKSMDKVLRRMLPTKLRDAILEAGTTVINGSAVHTTGSLASVHGAGGTSSEVPATPAQRVLPRVESNQGESGGAPEGVEGGESSMISLAYPLREVRGQVQVAVGSSSGSSERLRDGTIVQAQSAIRSIEDVCILVVRFKTPAILSSLVDSVELVRVMRLLGETVETCCIRRGGRRVSFHAFKMVFVFGLRPQDDDDLLESFVKRALLSASDALRSLHRLAQATNLVLAASASVHSGEVQLGLMDVPGSSWEVHGMVVENCDELATKAVLRLGGAVGSVLSISESAMQAVSEPAYSMLLQALPQSIRPSSSYQAQQRQSPTRGPRRYQASFEGLPTTPTTVRGGRIEHSKHSMSTTRPRKGRKPKSSKKASGKPKPAASLDDLDNESQDRYSAPGLASPLNAAILSVTSYGVRRHDRIPSRQGSSNYLQVGKGDEGPSTGSTGAGVAQPRKREHLVPRIARGTSPVGTVPGGVLRHFDSAGTRGSHLMHTSALRHKPAASFLAKRKYRPSVQVMYLPIRLDIQGHAQVWSELLHSQVEAACCVGRRASAAASMSFGRMGLMPTAGHSERVTLAGRSSSTGYWASPVDRHGGTILHSNDQGGVRPSQISNALIEKYPSRVSSRWPFLMLARLKRLRLLGSGGFGDVYEAVDVMGGKHYALKQFKRETVQREEVRNEITALSIIPKHPGIMRLAVCVALPQSINIVTELVDGVSLDNVVSGRHRMREDALQIVVAELVSALERIHLCGLVHRDIKPENVMVTTAAKGAHIKVLDFGLAERVDVPEVLLQNHRQNPLTESARGARTGVVGSSLNYADSRASIAKYWSVQHRADGLFRHMYSLSPCISFGAAAARLATIGRALTDGRDAEPSGQMIGGVTEATLTGLRSPVLSKEVKGHPMLMTVSLLVLDSTLIQDVDKLGISRRGSAARRGVARRRQQPLLVGGGDRETSDASDFSTGTTDSDNSEEPSSNSTAAPPGCTVRPTTHLRASPAMAEIERGNVEEEELRDLLGPMESRLHETSDVFGCIDADLRLGPSLVRSSDALRDAFDKDKNVIDMCVATDVDTVDFACGIAADIALHFRKCKEQIAGMKFQAAERYLLKAKYRLSRSRGGAGSHGAGGPSRAPKSASKSKAVLRAGSGHAGSTLSRYVQPPGVVGEDGVSDREAAPSKSYLPAAKDFDAEVNSVAILGPHHKQTSEKEKEPDTAAGKGSQRVLQTQDSKTETTAQMSEAEQLMLKVKMLKKNETSFLLPRVAIFVADGVAPDIFRTMYDAVSAILPGAMVFQQRSKVHDLYCVVLSHSFARSARWLAFEEQSYFGLQRMLDRQEWPGHYFGYTSSAFARTVEQEQLSGESTQADGTSAAHLTAASEAGQSVVLHVAGASQAGPHSRSSAAVAARGYGKGDSCSGSRVLSPGCATDVAADSANVNTTSKGASTTFRRVSKDSSKTASKNSQGSKRGKASKRGKQHRGATGSREASSRTRTGTGTGTGTSTSSGRKPGVILASSESSRRQAEGPMRPYEALLTAMPPVHVVGGATGRGGTATDGNGIAVASAQELEEVFQSPILVKRREVADGTAGTPHYIAPETAAGGGAGCSADWYSIGVLAFKCAAGRVPYDGRDFRSIFDKAKAGDVRWNLLSRSTSPALLDLLSRLLDRDPARRLRAVGPIKNHPFFAGVEWDQLFKRPTPLVNQTATVLPQYREGCFLSMREAVEAVNAARSDVSTARRAATREDGTVHYPESVLSHLLPWMMRGAGRTAAYAGAGNSEAVSLTEFDGQSNGTGVLRGGVEDS